jgi:vacuolar protein sorting-associated protein 13A/C
MRELALLTVNRIEFQYRSDEYVHLNLRVKSFQFDDLSPIALLRVAAAGYPLSEDDFIISFQSEMHQNTSLFTTCKDISFTMEPIIFFLDLSFVSDLLYFFRTFLRPKVQSLSFESPQPKETKSVPFTAANLVINQIALTIFIRSNTNRRHVYPQTMGYLKLIPDITNGQIVLPAFAFQDCTMTQSYVNSQIIQPLIKAGIRQAVRLLFKTDLFCPSTGTKSSNFARRTQRLMNGEIQVIGQMGSSALLQGGETILGSVSKLLHSVSFDRGAQIGRVNTTAKSTAIDSARAVGQGFLRGITGIIMDPIEMGRERGAIGVVLGIGKGLVGLVTKPVCGILDGGVGAMAALRKLVNNEDDDVIPPIRIARSFPAGEIGILSQVEGGKKVQGQVRFVDAVQFAIQMSKANRWDLRIEMFSLDAASKCWFAFTPTKLFVMDEEPKIVRVIELKNVRGIRTQGSIVIITGKDRSETIVVIDFSLALAIRDWVIARAMALRIGQ